MLPDMWSADAAEADPEKLPGGRKLAVAAEDMWSAEAGSWRTAEADPEKLPGARKLADAAEEQLVARSGSSTSERTPPKAGADLVVDEDVMKRWMISDSKGEATRARNTASTTIPGDGFACHSRNSRFSVRDWRWLQNIVLSPRFDWVAAVVILINALFVGVQVQVAANALSNEQPRPLQIAHICFCAFYVAELQLRIWAKGPRLFFSLHHRLRNELLWNSFDIAIVSASVFEVVLNFSMAQLGEDVTFLLMVRLARLTRIIRIIRNIKFFRELQMMVFSIYHTIKSLLWFFLLFMTVMYLFGIVITQATTDFLQKVPDYSSSSASVKLDTAAHCHSVDADTAEHYASACELRERFGSLFASMESLFESVAGGVSWGERSALLGQVHWSVEAYFIVFISFTLFAMLNVITGFFCEKAVDMAAQDKEHAVQEQLRNKKRYIKEMGMLFKDIDTDASGCISLGELESVLDDEKVKAYFASLQLDISAAWDIFRLLDKDGNCSVDVEEFALGCLRLRGHARAVDLANVQFEVEKLVQKLGFFMAYCECQFQSVLDQEAAQAVELQALQHSRAMS